MITIKTIEIFGNRVYIAYFSLSAFAQVIVRFIILHKY